MKGRMSRTIMVPTFHYAKELAYIESSGTQYIDTGFVPNQNTRVLCVVEFTPPSASSSAYLFGAREGGSSKKYAINGYGGAYQSMYGTATLENIGSAISGEFTIDKNKNVTTINGTSYTHTAETFTCPGNLYLFAMNNNGAVYAKSSAKLYSFAVYDNGTLVRDFIPVLDNDGVACLFDKVTKELCYNAGSGSFSYGEVG